MHQVWTERRKDHYVRDGVLSFCFILGVGDQGKWTTTSYPSLVPFMGSGLYHLSMFLVFSQAKAREKLVGKKRSQNESKSMGSGARKPPLSSSGLGSLC